MAIVVLVLAFTAYGVFAVQTSIEIAEKDAIQNVQLAVTFPSECGDITDLKNVNTPSHILTSMSSGIRLSALQLSSRQQGRTYQFHKK